jgi:uncharacterized protein (DUF1015 family)
MAQIAPFRGLRYNPSKISDLGSVVIPPYDVISAAEQQAFHAASPHNMIRIELGEALPGDDERNNPHTRAAEYLKGWQEEAVLLRDPRPVLYYYELDYTVPPGSVRTRYGFICALRLEDFSSGGVKPHEKTFQAVKDERLGLMMTCHANLSPIFALYSDPGEAVDQILRKGLEPPPAMKFRDRNGMEHRIWPVDDQEILREVSERMLDKAIFIADGHHRYETALSYRAIRRDRFGAERTRAPYEYVLMYLSNLNQGGLTILPTHRMLRNMGAIEPERFLKSVEGFFDVMTCAASESGITAWREGLRLCGERKETMFGFAHQGGGALYLLRAKQHPVMDYLAGIGVSEVLCPLDVVVLDQVVLKRIMGLSESFLANENNIHFKHDLEEGLADIQSGKYAAGFFINATRIDQVQEVANAGLIMPHKATYFYPKVGSGLVINPLTPDEEMVW